MSDFRCPHFPLLETLDIDRAHRDLYATLTHPSHPRHAEYRELIASGTAQRLREGAAANPSPSVVPTATLPTPPSPRLSVPETLKLLARMRACPHWVRRTDCGCGINECQIGKGRAGLVTHRDCFQCLKAQPHPDRLGQNS